MAKTNSPLFSEPEQKALRKAIALAEKDTSGEIRVHIESRCKEDVLDHAAFIFERLKMHETQARNGILFYLSLDDRKLAILGDVGINQKVDDAFWQTIRDEMIPRFQQNDMVGGLVDGIKKAGLELKKYFPYQTNDKNELSDDISFG